MLALQRYRAAAFADEKASMLTRSQQAMMAVPVAAPARAKAGLSQGQKRQSGKSGARKKCTPKPEQAQKSDAPNGPPL